MSLRAAGSSFGRAALVAAGSADGVQRVNARGPRVHMQVTYSPERTSGPGHDLRSASLAAASAGRDGAGSGHRSGVSMQSLGAPSARAQLASALLRRVRTVFRPAVKEVLSSLDRDNFARFRRTTGMAKAMQVVLHSRDQPSAATR